ncbi:MAG TPA: TetR/AcrR family transcriptional regulator [Ktedonobacterales bacterium]|nr:TetR/AcrR family transcriptional regulator [Ktedonobacterales bacterium]
MNRREVGSAPAEPPTTEEPTEQNAQPVCTRAERLRRGSRERREQEKRELRAAILQTAAEALLAQGYEAFSLRRVAEQLGYSATTIYLYFANKDDLIEAIVDDAFERLERQLMDALAIAEDDPRRRLTALADAYIHFGLEHPTAYRLMFLQRPEFLLSCRTGEKLPRVAAMRQLEDDVVAEAMTAGALPPGDPQGYADLLWSQMHGIVSLAIHFPMFDQARVRRTFRMMLASWGWDDDDAPTLDTDKNGNDA